MKIFNLIFASALLVSLAACSSDDGMLSPYDADADAVHIQPSVGYIVVSRTAPQEQESSTLFSSGDQIIVSRDGINEGQQSFYQYRYYGSK